MKKLLKKLIVSILQFEAKLVLKKYRPKIVAITGSVGKTSTKDAVYSVLAPHFFVRKSSKSFNSEIGVPLTILGLPNGWNNPFVWLKNIIDGLKIVVFEHRYPEWLVIEVGADRPNDIGSIAFWLKPDISIVTRLSQVPVHVEFFDSAEDVRSEKSQLVRATKPTGVTVLNADDVLVSTLRPLARSRVVTFGLSKHADVRASDYRVEYDGSGFPAGVSFVVQGANERVQMFGSVGQQQVYVALAGLAVSVSLGLDLDKSVIALGKHLSSPGRMGLIKGINKTCIIDDSYNSSPVAAAEALNTLSQINVPGRKVVVLGDMLELGEFTAAEHEKLGIKAAKVADLIVAVGPRSKGIFDSALRSGFDQEKVFYYSDSVTAAGELREKLSEGDLILVKGSQGVRMEKIVKMIMANPEQATDLLVRQEQEWLSR